MIPFDTYEFFGVPFYRKSSLDGVRSKIGIPTTIEKRENVDDVYIGTKGKFISSILNETKEFVQADENGVIDSPFAVREVGFYSEEIPYGRKHGIYAMDSYGDSEWWCVKKSELASKGLKLNGKVLSKAGETFTIPVGCKCLVIRGEFVIDGQTKQGPIPITADSSELTITSITDVVGLILVDLNN